MTEGNVPEWKRELVLRRQASGHAASVGPVNLTCPGVIISLRHPPSLSTSGMRLPTAPPDINQLLSQIEVDHINCKMVEENSVKVHSKSTRQSSKGEESLSGSSEELKYGPGIVSKLKNKYLSLTLRENHGKVRPALPCMRRATSLENLLDDTSQISDSEPKPQAVIEKSINLDNGPIPTRRTLSRNKENMKRARSVETMIRRPLKVDRVSNEQEKKNEYWGLRDNDDDDLSKKSKTRLSLDETELPPPHLVKSTLKLFEPEVPERSSSPLGKVSQNIRTAKLSKPIVSPKPSGLENKWGANVNGSQRPDMHFRKTEAATDQRLKRKVKIPAEIEIVEKYEVKNVVSNSNTPARAISKRDETDNVVKPCREESSSKLPVERWANGGTQPNNERSAFERSPSASELDSGILAPSSSPSPKPRSPPRVSDRKQMVVVGPFTAAPASTPSPSMKQVGVIRPIVALKSPPHPPSVQPIKSPVHHRERVAERNMINDAKSIQQPVSKFVVSLKKSAEECTPQQPAEKSSQGLWGPNAHSMVFNFSKRKDVPDYIENDGLVLKSQERPKNGDSGIILVGGSSGDSSTDDIDDHQIPPSTCQLLVVGGNILINGKSSLQKSPKQVKLRISFSDNATTFEYPSETSMLGESSHDAPKAAPVPVNVPIKSGSLASYTPSQLANRSDFQLGITKSAPVIVAPVRTTPELTDEEQYLRPADDANTIAWSAGNADDLLF